MIKKLFLLLSLFISINVSAQEMNYIKQSLDYLSSASMEGRGYVNNANNKAADFIAENLYQLDIAPIQKNQSLFQEYSFPVNTFPNTMLVQLNHNTLIAGKDYLVDAASSSFLSKQNQKIKTLDLTLIKDSTAWFKRTQSIVATDIYYLKNTEHLSKILNTNRRQWIKALPKACYLIQENQKLIWTVKKDTLSACILYLDQNVVLDKAQTATIAIENKFITQYPNKNIIGYIKGAEYADSFIVFTAHYDHLGKMGNDALFYGANDNASGTAFALALAQYFKKHHSKYSIAFMFFSGEEAGLMGSQYYVEQPLFPLNQIKTLINIDLMGDASDGITVVNGVKEKVIFSSLQNINKTQALLPQVKIRDNAPNSDHYPFTQHNVPAIFIYANGGKGYYHDIFDRASTISLKNIHSVFQLILQYCSSLENKQ